MRGDAHAVRWDLPCLGTREEADALPIPPDTPRTWLTATPVRVGPEVFAGEIWLLPTCSTKQFALTVEHTRPPAIEFRNDPIHGQCLSSETPDPLVVEAW